MRDLGRRAGLLHYATMLHWMSRALFLVTATLVATVGGPNAAHAQRPASPSSTPIVIAPKPVPPAARLRFSPTDEKRLELIAELARGRRTALKTALVDSERKLLADASAAFRAAKDGEARALLKKAAEGMSSRRMTPVQIRTVIGTAVYAGLIATQEAEDYADRMRFYSEGMTLLKANKAAILPKAVALSANGGTASVQLTRVSQTWSSGGFPGISKMTHTGDLEQFKTLLLTTNEEIKSLLGLIERTRATGNDPRDDDDARAEREAAILKDLAAAADTMSEMEAAILSLSN
jgi:hypothetical protein